MKILIYGIGGAMGRALTCALQGSDDRYCGVDIFADPTEFEVPVYKDCSNIPEKVDCIIDFSVRTGVFDYIPYALNHNIPCVIATTGYDKEELNYIADASKVIPIFKTGNMSIGINLLLKLVKEAAKTLKHSANIEIVEQHHSNKVDAPSGTALMLADGIKTVLPESDYVYGRVGITGKRTPNEIGIHSIRGGSIVGKHEVMFIMDKEIVTLKHETESKSVLANGSINAAHFIVKQAPGMYSMEDMLKNSTF